MSIRCARVPSKAFVVSVYVAAFVPLPPRCQQSGIWFALASTSSDAFCKRFVGAAGGTVTCLVADVAMLFAVSTARAASVTVVPAALLLFHATLYGLDVSVPTIAPLTRNSTRATPLASLASAASVTVPLTVAPAAGLVIATVGGVVSCGGRLDTVTVRAADVVLLFATSYAVAVSVTVWPAYGVVSHGSS